MKKKNRYRFTQRPNQCTRIINIFYFVFNSMIIIIIVVMFTYVKLYYANFASTTLMFIHSDDDGNVRVDKRTKKPMKKLREFDFLLTSIYSSILKLILLCND